MRKLWSPLNSTIREWTNKRVWIVGASSGIGLALAKALLDAGAYVTLSARSEATLLAFAAKYSRASVVAFDCADSQVWPSALSSTLAAMGHVDLVVLGAARYDPMNSWDVNIEQVEKSFELNVVSVYRALACLVPYFLARQSGGLAFIASISAYTGLPRALTYGATKAALNNLAETLYFELAPKGLSVYLINPGFVETPMTAKNDFKMPALITPQRAAAYIVSGLERGKFEISFPASFAGALRLISRLPYRFRFPLLHKMTGL